MMFSSSVALENEGCVFKHSRRICYENDCVSVHRVKRTMNLPSSQVKHSQEMWLTFSSRRRPFRALTLGNSLVCDNVSLPIEAEPKQG